MTWIDCNILMNFVILDLLSKGAYQKSELAGRSGHFENEIGFFREFSLKTHHCYAYYVEIKWSGCTVLIKSGILFANGLVWPASSDL